MIYTTFAKVYDQLMDSDLYDQWLTYVEQRVPKKTGRLLELACGSGTLAVKLAQAGFEVTGFDLSEEMLTLADEKARAAEIELPLIQGDALDLKLDTKFDYVTCFDDSICYLPDLSAITQVFKNVSQVLKPAGTFMFDAHSLYQMDEVFPGYMYNAKFEDMAFMWQSYAGEFPHSVEHDLTFFIYDESIDGYQALEELHRERTYPVASYKEALQAAGFTDIEVTSEFGTQSVLETSTRYFFKCKNQS
ncbi:class I SAM-dependent DNA methyltransferase [Agrilactobacillus yilanensis]|uniref:Class I SAM-dependent DNA methyltransferase n=1 Tax=Agrilactobacillus yilanensis TaxID=2485997 RepID=A0ABW4J8Q9_9LACO|nr:class I SAM-dependent methyltransferase [Agrilactobacillus yilanensis]